MYAASLAWINWIPKLKKKIQRSLDRECRLPSRFVNCAVLSMPNNVVQSEIAYLTPLCRSKFRCRSMSYDMCSQVHSPPWPGLAKIYQATAKLHPIISFYCENAYILICLMTSHITSFAWICHISSFAWMCHISPFAMNFGTIDNQETVTPPSHMEGTQFGTNAATWQYWWVRLDVSA